MLSLQEQVRATSAPKVYVVDSIPDSWVAEATDGCLYIVPNQPGGWMRCESRQCDVFKGRREELRPLPSQEARSVVWFVYGDVGTLVIAEG
jgi:hypothetical protein